MDKTITEINRLFALHAAETAAYFLNNIFSPEMFEEIAYDEWSEFVANIFFEINGSEILNIQNEFKKNTLIEIFSGTGYSFEEFNDIAMTAYQKRYFKGNGYVQ